jgi:hypothetical protein
MNPYYLAYCKANKNTPEIQMEQDQKSYPGGVMCGFILWISNKKSKFRRLHPEFCLDGLIYNYSEWGKFLEKEAESA